MAVKRISHSAPDSTSGLAGPAPDHRGDANIPPLRQPQQERGERRVSAILDAAASLIVEVGPEGLTVQALADRAHTSKGSLYHFFPDLPAVLRALADRHVAAIEALTHSLIADAGVDWRLLTVEQTVRRFLAPLAYLETHPDLLALARAPQLADQRTRRLAPICDLADHLLRQRYPRMAEDHRHVRASTMVAVLDGVVGFSLRTDAVDAHEMMVELGRVLAGYLGALDVAEGRAPKLSGDASLSTSRGSDS